MQLLLRVAMRIEGSSRACCAQASLEEERERSELAEQSQSAWEVYATCATAVSVVLLGAAIVGFARSS